MKRRFAALVMAMVFLTGCHAATDSLQPGLTLREKMLSGDSCQFRAEVRADFGETEYTFSLDCRAEKDGTVQFKTLEPQSIADISGYVDQQSGKLTFDEAVLTFPHLADGELSPVCGPWLFYKALTSGYLRACGADGDMVRLTIDDSFRGENMTVEVWLESGIPVCAEIIWQGRNILTLSVSDFRIL